MSVKSQNVRESVAAQAFAAPFHGEKPGKAAKMKKSRAARFASDLYKSIGAGRKLRRSGKSNITAKRLTVPLGFLSYGIKSQVVHKSGGVADETGEFDEPHNILEEDLHGLFLGETATRPRRSSRLSKRNESEGEVAPGYLLDAIARKGATAKPPRDRSKSLFREITEKYAESRRNFADAPRPTDSVRKQPQANDDFAARLFGDLVGVELNDPAYYKDKIAGEVLLVNDILAGKLDPAAMSGHRKRQINEEDKENIPIKFPYIPQSNWVYNTPPNRKLHFEQVRLENEGLHPALVGANQGRTFIYEMDKRINVDLRCYRNRQEIDIDHRYMVEVANMPNKGPDSLQCTREVEMEYAGEVPNKQLPKPESYELENHFLSLTCRPKKPVQTVSRVKKRKREIFDPQPGCSSGEPTETPAKFEADFSLISSTITSAEESFTFKFTPTGRPDGHTVAHLFDCGGREKDTFDFRCDN